MRYCLGDPRNTTDLWLALGFMPFGLFFDFFDGKVARWRKKSSLMGQELDSLADLVSAPLDCSASGGLLRAVLSKRLGRPDLIRRRPRGGSVRHRLPEPGRPRSPDLFRALRPDASRPIQCYRRHATQGQDWEVQVL